MLITLSRQLRLLVSNQELPDPKHPQPIILKKIKGASFKKALELNSQGDWQKAANHFYTIMAGSKSPDEQAEALMELVQMFINNSQYEEAEKTLYADSFKILDNLNGRSSVTYQADYLNRLGWIYDLIGENHLAIENFLEVKSLINKPKNEKEEDLLSTANHFLARNNTMLGFRGVFIEWGKVEDLLERDLKRFQKMRKDGKPKPANEGFQWEWLALVDILKGDLKEAKEKVQKVKKFFKENEKVNPKSGAIGHYEKIAGLLELEQGNIDEARKHFENCLNAFTEIQMYTNGQTHAWYGMALCDLAEGKEDVAIESFKKAYTLNPYVLNRGLG